MSKHLEAFRFLTAAVCKVVQVQACCFQLGYECGKATLVITVKVCACEGKGLTLI